MPQTQIRAALPATVRSSTVLSLTSYVIALATINWQTADKALKSLLTIDSYKIND